VNHTTQVILAIVVAAALVAGMFASGTQAAQAGGGRHKYKGSGDSVAFEQENKQKAKCLALVISRADACNQEAQNNFNVPGNGGGGGGGNNPPEECASALPNTRFDIRVTTPFPGQPAGVQLNDEICIVNLGTHDALDITATPDLTINRLHTDESTNGRCSQGTPEPVTSVGSNPPGSVSIGSTVCVRV
jgi:hypothetical protein